MKVMFDSNIWQKVAMPEEYTDDSQIDSLFKIHDAIVDGRIEAYISECIFTLENIQRKERKSKLGSMRAKIDTSVKSEGNEVSMGFALGPDPKDAVSLDDNEHLKKPTQVALEMGFHIVRLPRIGGLTNIDVEPVLYNVHDFNAYYEKATEVSDKIEAQGAGYAQLRELVKNNQGNNILKKIQNSSEADKTKIAKAIAEMVDGDAVATSIGLGCDYFCTRDEAKGAGSKSVLSSSNLSWLKSDYGFETIKPEDLAVLI